MNIGDDYIFSQRGNLCDVVHAGTKGLHPFEPGGAAKNMFGAVQQVRAESHQHIHVGKMRLGLGHMVHGNEIERRKITPQLGVIELAEFFWQCEEQ